MTPRVTHKKKTGRKKAMSPSLSREIVTAACNKAGGPYHLSKFVEVSHPHLSRARTGENGVSLTIAQKLIKYLGDSAKREWIKL